jgi:histidinol-phosphate phosphatase family protein
MIKAVFLDRDGTISEDIGDCYRPSHLRFIPRALEALQLLQRRFRLFIVTNQPGIGAGRFREAAFEEFNRYFLEVLGLKGVVIEKVYCCPHTKESGCGCRKPSPFFLAQAAAQFEIDLPGSYVVGDHPSDMELARRAGTKAVYVLTGHGAKHRPDLPDDFTSPIAANLYAAVRYILPEHDVS